MARRVGESWWHRRAGKLVAATGVGSLLLGACDVPPSTEPLPDYPVPSLSPVNPNQQAPVTSANSKRVVLPVCKGVFVDLAAKRATVYPVADAVPDPHDSKKTAFFPKKTHFQGPTTGSVDPATWYDSGTFRWYDSTGKDLGEKSPDCPKQGTRITTVIPMGIDKGGVKVHAFVGDSVHENQLVDVETPGSAKLSGVLSREFAYEGVDDLRAILRSVTAAVEMTPPAPSK